MIIFLVWIALFGLVAVFLLLLFSWLVVVVVPLLKRACSFSHVMCNQKLN